MNEAEIKAAIAEGERVNRIVEAALALPGLRVGDTISVKAPSGGPLDDGRWSPFVGYYEPVLITPELWARIEARR